MAVIRKIKKSDFTVIDNNIFKNKKLSLKGKGMICTMLSLPDGWEFSEMGLCELSNDSRTGIRSTLKELMDLGYLKRERNRDSKGRLKDTAYTVYEVPMYQNPTLEKPTLEKVHNKILNNKELNNKNITVVEILENNGFNLTPIQYDVVKEWDDNELTRYAIKQAVLNNKFNIKYIDKIIYTFKKENIKTVQQAIEREEKFKNKSYKKTNIPEWFDKEYKEEEIDDETRKLIEEIEGSSTNNS